MNKHAAGSDAGGGRDDAAMPPGATTSAAEAPWTTRRLLRWITAHFDQLGIDSPRVCAEMLLGKALRCERLALYMDPDRPASAAERAILRDFVRRVAAHEPVQYIVGEAWFFSRAFEVSPVTLIPRPSTERLVEEAVSFLRGRPEARVLDLCTGTGCVAISIASTPGVRASVLGTDCEPAAIELARRNAARHRCERVSFAVGDLYGAIGTGSSFDLIAANPPYVSDSEWEALEPNVRLHEPARALRGGADGMELIRRVVAGAPERLAPDGLLLVEIGHAQRDAAEALAATTPGLRDCEILKDHEDLWRLLRARRD